MMIMMIVQYITQLMFLYIVGTYKFTGLVSHVSKSTKSTQCELKIVIKHKLCKVVTL